MALRNGSRFGVSTQEVFPAGCHLLPDSIAEAMDYDEKTKTRRPAVDKVTGKRVWQCRVQDMDPELAGRSREAVVKILADQMPQPPTRQLFEAVEFEGLVVTPYVTDRGRLAYSLRATGLKAARHQAGKDAA
ncbi:MAG TPA: plasmid replication, integration and excision activator [Streptosporangiaceae bacterium]|nr:plasmid replication, integration and excision activator [Streptosporangiaceae bacterium]